MIMDMPNAQPSAQVEPAPVETIVVRAARLSPSPTDPVFSIVRLKAEDLQSSPRLDEALKAVPGASLFRRTSSLSANPTSQGLSLRAIAPSGAGRALVTLDGIPQNDPFGGWVIWTALPPEGLSGASVVRGAGAGAYGAGALTGVVLRGLHRRDGEVDGRAGGADHRTALQAVPRPRRRHEPDRQAP